jgi:hypothetical protein
MAEKAKKVLPEKDKFTVMDLDHGRLVELLNEAVKAVALDVKSRPGNRKPRKIVWEIQMMPSEAGDFVTVMAEKPKVTLPKDKAISTICGMPDDEGNLRNLNVTYQKSLPINIVQEGDE